MAQLGPLLRDSQVPIQAGSQGRSLCETLQGGAALERTQVADRIQVFGLSFRFSLL